MPCELLEVNTTIFDGLVNGEETCSDVLVRFSRCSKTLRGFIGLNIELGALGGCGVVMCTHYVSCGASWLLTGFIALLTFACFLSLSFVVTKSGHPLLRGNFFFGFLLGQFSCAAWCAQDLEPIISDDSLVWWFEQGVFSICSLGTVVLLTRAHFRDPGVIMADPTGLSCPGPVVDTEKGRGLSHEKGYIKQGERYCRTCRIDRPQRSKHCALCDKCVADFDHHCVFIGNDVGRGNHRSFLLFLICYVLTSAQFVLRVAVRNRRPHSCIKLGPETLGCTWAGHQTTFTESVATHGILWGLANAALVVVQLRQVSMGRTTNEQINRHKPRYSYVLESESAGLTQRLRNMLDFWSGPLNLRPTDLPVCEATELAGIRGAHLHAR
mmetsp:Transcript_21743/g.49163  ORF Transcript_21743/g.49163 Transcript_21743/m.49163 type:complete len:382 (-) Transcript_21743:178-1323(-)